MKRSDPAPARAIDRNAFLILLVVLTVALAWIIWPFYGGVFWGAVLALLFQPLYRKLLARLRSSGLSPTIRPCNWTARVISSAPSMDC